MPSHTVLPPSATVMSSPGPLVGCCQTGSGQGRRGDEGRDRGVGGGFLPAPSRSQLRQQAPSLRGLRLLSHRPLPTPTGSGLASPLPSAGSSHCPFSGPQYPSPTPPLLSEPSMPGPRHTSLPRTELRLRKNLETAEAEQARPGLVIQARLSSGLSVLCDINSLYSPSPLERGSLLPVSGKMVPDSEPRSAMARPEAWAPRGAARGPGSVPTPALPFTAERMPVTWPLWGCPCHSQNQPAGTEALQNLHSAWPKSRTSLA